MPARFEAESLAVDAEGSLWIGTLGEGVVHFKGETWVFYVSPGG